MSLSYKNPSSIFKNLSKERLVDMFCFFEFQVSRTHGTRCLLFKAALKKRSAHAKVLNDNGLNVKGIKGRVSFKMSHMSEKTFNKPNLKRFVSIWSLEEAQLQIESKKSFRQKLLNRVLM